MPHAIDAQDRIAIHDLVSRYAWALSTGDVDAFVGLFTPEATIEDRGSGRTGQGAEGLRSFIAGALAKVQGMPRQYRTSHVEIRPVPGDPDRCRVRSFWQIQRSIAGRAHPYLIGHYDDVCARDALGWRFVQRIATAWHGDRQPWAGRTLPPPPLPDSVPASRDARTAVAVARPAPEDWARIHQLFGRFAWALDTGDVQGLAALFTPDGWIDDPGPGRQAAELYARRMADRPAERSEALQHWVGNLLIEGDGDACTVRSFWTTVAQGPEMAQLRRIGHYDDRCVRSEGDWRFASRCIRPWEEGWVPWASASSASAAAAVVEVQA